MYVTLPHHHQDLLTYLYPGISHSFLPNTFNVRNNSGNLYYFTWFSFLVSISIVASCYSEMTGGNVSSGTSTTDEAEKAANGEIQVENIPSDQEQF